MEGETENSEVEGSFSKASIPKRIAIVIAGATVNIVFGLIVYFILVSTSDSFYLNVDFAKEGVGVFSHIKYGLAETGKLVGSMFESMKMLFTGKTGIDQMMGPVGISEVVSKTSGFREFMYIMAMISVSLGVTNLLPIPALDGGKILLLIIEAIRRKPLNQNTEINLQLLGFSLLIALSLIVTYNDIFRLLN